MRYKSSHPTLVSLRSGNRQRLKTLQQIFQHIPAEIYPKLRELKPTQDLGERPYDPVIMFKITVLQRLYQLSDRQVIAAIRDWISFQKALDIYQDKNIPSRSTLSRFKQTLGDREDKFWQQLLYSLEDKGYKLSLGRVEEVNLNTPKQNKQNPSSIKKESSRSPSQPPNTIQKIIDRVLALFR